MDLIYSMRRKPLKCEPPHFESLSDPEVTRPLVTISSASIIAFSSPTELNDADGETWGGHVYVCDLETPWDCHKVTSTVHPVSALEWDGDGRQLLVATTVGEITVYGQKDYLLNEWTSLYSANNPGEHIVAGIFFHSGRRVTLTDKKADAPITDRVITRKMAPTLKGFGGIAIDGVCAVTASGAVCVTSEQHTHIDSLSEHRELVTSACMKHLNNGKILIAACYPGRIRCVSLTVHRAPRPPTLQPLAAICVSRPTAICWLAARDDTNSLFVAAPSACALWTMTERAHAPHKLLGSTTPGGQKPTSDCFNTLSWSVAHSWPLPSVAHLAAPAAPVLAAPAPVLAAQHTKIHLLSREGTSQIISAPVVTSGGPGTEAVAAGATPPKKTKYAPGTLPSGCPAVVSSAAVSPLAAVCVLLDTHSQLHVYKIPLPGVDIPSQLAVQPAQSLLEYSLVHGVDCTDVLMTLPPPAADALYDRLTEWFQRQPAAFQQYYYQRWLTLRIALLSLSPSPASASAAAALTRLQGLFAACAGAAAACRADDVDDTPPHDTDKALLSLEAAAEGCSALALQALRRQAARAQDTATAVLKVHAQAPTTRYSMSSDPVAIWTLRKLLSLTGVGGGAGGARGALHRALQRLQAGKDPEEPSLLSAVAPVPRSWDGAPRCNVSAPHGQSRPHIFEYLVEPASIARFTPEPTTNADAPSILLDAVRYTYLGGRARVCRCTRCGARAAPAPAAPAPAAAAGPTGGGKLAAQRACDRRFLPSCRCGGKWTLTSNV